MRLLSTTLILVIGSIAVAEDSLVRHPVIGDKPARELLNSDLLDLPEKERQAWVHGAATMAAQMVATERPELAGCILNWFTGEGNGQERLSEIMSLFPEKHATSTVFAVGKMACSDL